MARRSRFGGVPLQRLGNKERMRLTSHVDHSKAIEKGKASPRPHQGNKEAARRKARES